LKPEKCPCSSRGTTFKEEILIDSKIASFFFE